MSTKGRIFVFEGLDGSGKTTHVGTLAKSLEEAGHTVHVYREPGGTPYGEEIRSLLVKRPFGDLDPMTETFLLMASRRILINRVREMWEQGVNVIIDRFVFSTYAYQCCGKNLPVQALLDMYDYASTELPPIDHIIYMVNEKQKEPEDQIEVSYFDKRSKIHAGFEQLFNQHNWTAGSVFMQHRNTPVLRVDITGSNPSDIPLFAELIDSTVIKSLSERN